MGEPTLPSQIISSLRDTEGATYLACGSPHAYGARRAWLEEALRKDLSLFRVERAARVVRGMPPHEGQPHPELCTPYLEANGLGFTLKPRLPLLFVKTRRGELLPDARTALAYARENQSEFADTLAQIEEWAQEVLDRQVVERSEADAPELFRDLAQPYRAFAPGILDIPLGLYVMTPPGVGTLIGPPVNRPAPLPVVSGLVETDWHHKELFLVTPYPRFENRTLVVSPEQVVAQMYFVSYEQASQASVEHSESQAGGEPAYTARWKATTRELAAAGTGVVGTLAGVASVTVECLHCRVSITRAAEGQLPHDHEVSCRFVSGYRHLRRETQQARREP